MDSRTTQNSRLIPVADWPKFHPWPPIGGLRHLLFHRRSNGFERAVVRSGRRLLIDEAAFFECLRNPKLHNEVQS